MVLHKRRLIVFGGVHDEDTADGEGLISSFYNDLHSYSLDANKWHGLELVAPRRGGGGKAKAARQGGGAVLEGDEEVDEALGSLLLDGGGRRRNLYTHHGLHMYSGLHTSYGLCTLLWPLH